MKELESWILKGLKTTFTKEKYLLYYLKANWGEIVGEVTAKHTQPVRLINGILTVNADNAAWSNNFLMLKKQFLGKINGFIPVEAGRKHALRIKDVRFYTGSLPPEPQIKAADEEPFMPKLDPNHRCPICGVMLLPWEKRCGSCERAQLNKEREEIHKILCKEPWLKHSDCVKWVNCDKITFNDVKAKLLENAIWQGIKKDATQEEKLFPVLLERSLTPDQVTEELLKKTLLRFRRSRIYVSPLRKQLPNKKK